MIETIIAVVMAITGLSLDHMTCEGYTISINDQGGPVPQAIGTVNGQDTILMLDERADGRISWSGHINGTEEPGTYTLSQVKINGEAHPLVSSVSCNDKQEQTNNSTRVFLPIVGK